MPTLLTWSYIALWAIVLLQSALLLGAIQAQYRLQHSGLVPSSGDRPGGESLERKSVPQFSATALSGHVVRWTDFNSGSSVVVFVSPDCSSCIVTLDELEMLKTKVGGRVIVACRGSLSACSALVAAHDIDVPVIADEDFALSAAFGVTSVPTAVLIEDGIVRSVGHPKRDSALDGGVVRIPVSK